MGWLLASVLLATLVFDGAAMLFARGPVVGVGRWVIGLAAGFLGMRFIRSLPRVVTAAWGGMVLATLLTAAVYVFSGRAAAEFLGRIATIGLLLAGVVIGILAPTAGALAWLVVEQVRRRRA